MGPLGGHWVMRLWPHQWANTLMEWQLNRLWGGGRNFKWWDKVEEVVTEACWIHFCLQSLSLTLSLLLGHHEVSSFLHHVPSTMTFCLTTGPTELSDHGWKPLNCNQISLSSFQLIFFLQEFCHSNGKLANTYDFINFPNSEQ